MENHGWEGGGGVKPRSPKGARGAVGGGVITFQTPQGQRVAAATGLTEVLWPTEITTAKVSILGLK